MVKRALTILCLLFAVVNAQNLRVIRYVPGNFFADAYHRIELFNPTNADISLSGYVLVTRHYSVVFPASAKVPAGKVLTIGKKLLATETPGYELHRSPDFLIRFPDRQFEGNYFALYNSSMRIVDAFYHCPLKDAPFLPDADTAINSAGKKIPFALPPPQSTFWAYFPARDDPAVAYKRDDRGWSATSRKSIRNPVTEYRNFSLAYKDGVVTVKWATSFEVESKFHVVERSLDGETFVEMERLPVKSNTREISQYEWYDDSITEGNAYYYQVRCSDMPGVEISTGVKEVKCDAGAEEFNVEIFSSSKKEEGISIRFYSRYSQKVRMKILDKQYHEVAVVFNGFVNAQSRTMLRYKGELPRGTYRVVADTDTRRWVQDFVVE